MGADRQAWWRGKQLQISNPAPAITASFRRLDSGQGHSRTHAEVCNAGQSRLAHGTAAMGYILYLGTSNGTHG
jgi:hypothetical protein